MLKPVQKMFALSKHSSLFCWIINEEEKRLKRLKPGEEKKLNVTLVFKSNTNIFVFNSFKMKSVDLDLYE